MKITETTTFAELMSERIRLGIEYLAINARPASGSLTSVAIVEIPGESILQTIFGHGHTEAEAIDNLFEDIESRRDAALKKGSSSAPPIAAG